MSPVEYYGFSLYFHDAGLFHGDTSLLQNTTAKFSTAILLQHFRNTKILGRPIYQMRKAPGDCPGASFFALYQRISPLHTHLCSLGDEPRGGASLGASLAVQVLQHAPGEADVNAHRRHIHNRAHREASTDSSSSSFCATAYLLQCRRRGSSRIPRR